MTDSNAAESNPCTAQRQAMVATIEAIAREAASETGRDRLSRGVLNAMAKVPRHRFVPENQRPYAYSNRPLPIGNGQTISQPFIVALMTDLLDLNATERVLEIGTGCGYQTAVLAELAQAIYTIEIVDPLAVESAARFEELGFRNITARAGDGYGGWPEHAPFDKIIVTAAATEVPPALSGQLKAGGKLLIPAGPAWQSQSLLLVEKESNGRLTSRNVLGVRFVPLTRAAI